MIDLSRPQKPHRHDPNAVELIGLIVTIAIWTYILIGAMM